MQCNSTSFTPRLFHENRSLPRSKAASTKLEERWIDLPVAQFASTKHYSESLGTHKEAVLLTTRHWNLYWSIMIVTPSGLIFSLQWILPNLHSAAECSSFFRWETYDFKVALCHAHWSGVQHFHNKCEEWIGQKSSSLETFTAFHNKCDEWKGHKKYQSIDIHGRAFLYSHDPSASLGTNLCAFTWLYKPKKLTLHFGQVTMISALLCFAFIPFSP